MAGKVCPSCGEQTFFLTHGQNRKCSRCGYTMTVPANKGKGGKGTKCANCGRNTVFDNKCTNHGCGATYKAAPKNRKAAKA